MHRTYILDKNDYDRHILHAVDLFNRKKFNSALKHFNKLARVNPNNLKIHELLVYIHLEMGNLTEAKAELALYKQLLKEIEDVELENPQMTLEKMAEEAGSETELTSACSSIMKGEGSGNIDSDTSKILNLTILYISQGRFDEADKLVSGYREQFLEITGIEDPLPPDELTAQIQPE